MSWSSKFENLFLHDVGKFYLFFIFIYIGNAQSTYIFIKRKNYIYKIGIAYFYTHFNVEKTFK